MGADRFEFDIALTKQDYLAYGGAARRGPRAWRWWGAAASFAAGLVAGLAALMAHVVSVAGGGLIAVLAVLAFQAGWYACVWQASRTWPKPRADGAIFTAHMVIDAAGTRIAQPTREWLVRWSAFEALDARPGALVLRARGARPVIIPRRCIASPTDAGRLERFISARIAGGGEMPIRAAGPVRRDIK
jgi:hypothetical protein